MTQRMFIVDSCFYCPWFVEIKTYTKHAYRCKFFGYESSPIFCDDIEKAKNEMDNFFQNECTAYDVKDLEIFQIKNGERKQLEWTKK